MRKFIRTVTLFLMGMLFALQNTMAQCAMCRATVENNVSAGDTGLASGLNLGILYLFVTPYVVIGMVAFMWYKKSKENAQKISLAGRFRRKMS